MQVIKYGSVFCKKGDMAYISHLDLMRLLRRAIRRADMPFFLTGGFNPRVKISMPSALKLGVESDELNFTLCLTEELSPRDIQEKLNRELPEGIKISKTTKLEK